MQVVLNYGKTGLAIDLADDWDVTVIRKRPMPILPHPEQSVLNALSDPIGCGTLREEANGRGDACIAVCDITRPMPNRQVLPVVIRELLSSGIPAQRITVLVATGLHRPNEGDELKELIGDRWVLDTVNVVNHFAGNDGDHVYLGKTTMGIPVRLDRRFVAADLRIVIGLVEPHFMAGYSGGRKLVAPGIAHEETIRHLHRSTLLDHPHAANCVLDGNPVHAQQLEITDMVGRILAANAVIDDCRRLSFLSFGEIKESHLAAVSFVRPYAEIPLSRRYSTVLTSAAGYPLDNTYYQTVKGMVAAMDAVISGGNLIVASACSEGMGSREYVDAQQRLMSLGLDAFDSDLKSKCLADIDEWMTQMQIKAMRTAKIFLYTDGLSDRELELTGVNRTRSIEESIRRSVEESGGSDIAVIPEGPYVVPVYAPETAGAVY